MGESALQSVQGGDGQGDRRQGPHSGSDACLGRSNVVQKSHCNHGVQLGGACRQSSILHAWPNSRANKMAGDVRHSAWRLGQQTRQGFSGTAKAPKCREDDKVRQEDITAVEIGDGKRPTRSLTPLVGVLAGGCGVDRPRSTFGFLRPLLGVTLMTATGWDDMVTIVAGGR